MSAPRRTRHPERCSRGSRARRRAPGAHASIAGKTLDGRLTLRRAARRRSRRSPGGCTASSACAPGDRVAVLAPNRLEVPVLVLALLRLGAVVVPLNPAAPPEDWAYILAPLGRARRSSRPRELLGARRPSRRVRAFTLLDRGRVRAAALAPRRRRAAATSPSELAVVLYTSGHHRATPRASRSRQRNLLCQRLEHGAATSASTATTQLAVLPLYHAHAFGFGLMTALSTGGHLVFTERLEPFAWAEVHPRASRWTVTSVVPTLLPMLLAARVTAEKVPTLRHILVSSAPLAVDVARDFEARTQHPAHPGLGPLGVHELRLLPVARRCRRRSTQRLMFSLGGAVASAPRSRAPRCASSTATGAERGGGRARRAARPRPLDDARLLRGPRGHRARPSTPSGWLHTGDEGFFRDARRARRSSSSPGASRRSSSATPRSTARSRSSAGSSTRCRSSSGSSSSLGFPHREHGEEVGAYVEVEALDDDAARAPARPRSRRMPVARAPEGHSLRRRSRSRARTPARSSAARCSRGSPPGALTAARSSSKS